MPAGFFKPASMVSVAPTKNRRLPQCGACGLCKTCKSPKMGTVGEGGLGVLFIAEHPSKDEDSIGIQLVDKASKYLKSTLKRFDFDLDTDGWKTNAIACLPVAGNKVTNKEVGFCRPNVLKTIKELNPRVIVLLGASPVESVIGHLYETGAGGVARWQGFEIPSQELNAWVCTTYSPAYVLHENDPVIREQFKCQLEKAVSRVGRPWPDGVPEWRKMVKCVTDPSEAARWLRGLLKQTKGAIAWDYETNKLKPDTDTARIISCSVAWGIDKPERCIAFPWHGEAIEAMGEVLRSPIPKIASNIKFEDRWSRMQFGHRVRAWAWDTMVAAHVLDNRRGITSVKCQAFILMGVPLWDKKVENFIGAEYSNDENQLKKVALRDLLIYNGLDSIFEFCVAVRQIQDMEYPIPWRTE